MIISFKVKNYRSIKDEMEISFIQTDTRFRKMKDHYIVYKEGKTSLLLRKVMVIYGANASGKSNVLLALIRMKITIQESIKYDTHKKIPAYDPFLLDDESKKSPTEFEICFVHENKSYRYGFSFDADAFLTEYLYENIFTENKLVFRRDGQKFTQHYETELTDYNRTLERIISPKELLLSREFRNTKFTYRNFEEFIYQIPVLPTGDLSLYPWELVYLIIDEVENLKKIFFKILSIADHNISEFKIVKDNEDIENDNIQDKLLGSLLNAYLNKNKPYSEKMDRVVSEAEREELKTHTKHTYKSADGTTKEIFFDLETQESAGTQRFFILAFFITMNLIEGKALILDELNNSLHPQITRFIIDLYHRPESNPNGAQLLFTIHDTEFIDLAIFRPDQICLVEKDRHSHASVLYSLDDFELPKNKTKFEDWYLEGRFGAVPSVGFFVLPEEFIQNKPQNQDENQDQTTTE